MEYPMFITAGCLWGIPDGLRLTENVVIHEFGHNYFMGLLATNEFEEAYLDEGFNTYFEGRIMDQTYGAKTSMIDLLGFHAGDGEISRSSYVHMRNPKIAEMNRPAWKYTHGGYGSITYQKTATWLRTMQNIIGEETMDSVMTTYYDRWKFKHPSGQDFVNVANEVIKEKHGDKFGENMNWYFDQMLNGTNICDYKVASISNQKIKRDRGIYDSDGKKMLFKNNSDSTVTYKSKVILYRMGEVIVPQDVLIHFEDGEEVLEKWDGKARTFDFTYHKPNKIEWVKVDPYNKIWIDVNMVNNSLTTQPQTTSIWKYATKVLFWAENMMASFFL
jgi:hypothetical protein